MLQNKVTRGLLFVLVFVVVLNVGLLVSGRMVGNNTNQVASVASSREGSGSGDRGEGEDQRPCRASSGKANNFTKFNDFGLGTALQPYEIWNPTQFKDIANAGGDPYYYLQCKDISFANQTQFTIPLFVGHYNGNYYYLQEYKYIGSNVVGPVGIFSVVSNGASLEHMRIARSEVQLTDQSGSTAVLVGDLKISKLNDIKLYSSSSIAPYTTAAALVVYSGSSEITNIEVHGTTVRAKVAASGVVDNSLQGVLKNIKVIGGTVLATDGRGSGIVSHFVSPSGAGVFENISYKGTSVSGTRVAGIASVLYNATLSQAEVEAPLYAAADSTNNSGVGGVVLQALNSSIEKVHFNGTINRQTAAGGACDNNSFAGGVVGLLQNSKVFWSYATGQIKVTNNCSGTGGVAGVATDSTIQNSYADLGFFVSGANGALGGLVGSTSNMDNSLSSYYKNRTTIRIVPASGAKVKILGGHLGLVTGSTFPSDMSYTNGAIPDVSAAFAGPYIGLYSNTYGNNSVPSTIYYVESNTCSGNCNTIGTAKSQAYLLNPINLPMKIWEFSPTNWVQASINVFPTIPSAKSNF